MKGTLLDVHVSDQGVSALQDAAGSLRSDRGQLVTRRAGPGLDVPSAADPGIHAAVCAGRLDRASALTGG